MLKRLQSKKSVRQSYISSPVLVETTLDEGAYHELTDAGVPLNVTAEWQPQLLEHKFQQHHHHQQQPRTRPKIESLRLDVPQRAKFRPASSIYSQPTPNDPNLQFSPEAIHPDNIEISPPSSPELDPSAHLHLKGHFRSRGEEAVSPIEETEESPMEPTTPPNRSYAEVRREKRRQDGAAQNANLQARRATTNPADNNNINNNMNRNGYGRRTTSAAVQGDMNGDRNEDRNGRRAASAAVESTAHGNGKKDKAAPKYDPYTGEPTVDEKGRPQQVKPSTFHGSDKPVHVGGTDGMGTRTSVTANAAPVSSTFSDRLRKLRERNVVIEESRPAWKGSSGRQAVIEPPTQPANSKPFSIPRKAPPSNRRGSSKENEKNFGGIYSDSNNSLENIERLAVATPKETHPALRDRSMSPQSDSAHEELQEEPQDDSLLKWQISPQKLDRYPKTREHRVERAEDLQDISVGVVERNFREALKESNLVSSKANYPEGQLPSKFSVTTYEPSNYQATTRPTTSDENWGGGNTLPIARNFASARYDNGGENGDPIVHRTRPRIGSFDSTTTRASVITRKPVAGSTTTTRAATNPVSTTTISKGQKQLPLTPAQEAANKAQDLIPMLNARQDDLRRRRLNIEASIKQMTELMPQDGLLGGIGGALVAGGNMRHHVVGAVGGSSPYSSNQYSQSGTTMDRPGLRRGRSVMGEKFTEKRREEEKIKVAELRSELADVRKEEHEIGLKLHRAYKRSDDLYYTSPLWVKRVVS